jgi:cephalosporin-C deacetylase-like acetyl esterase
LLFDTASLGASLEAGCGQSLAFFSDCIEPHFQRVICYYPFLGLRRRVLVKRDFVAENPYNNIDAHARLREQVSSVYRVSFAGQWIAH